MYVKNESTQIFTKEYFVQKSLEFAKELKVSEDCYDVSALASSMFGIYDALLHERSVFAACVKEPHNLDAGNHYFDVHYVDENGETTLFWPGAKFFKPLGGQRSRVWYTRGYVWASGAIGMSRLLDATDGIFNLLRSWTGMYAQIDCLN